MLYSTEPKINRYLVYYIKTNIFLYVSIQTINIHTVSSTITYSMHTMQMLEKSIV